MEEKRASCKVGFEGYDWQNVFTVQSPTGKIIALHCNGRWSEMSQALKDLIDKYQYTRTNGKNFKWSSFPAHPEEILYSIMAEIKKLSETEPPKVKCVSAYRPPRRR